SAVFAMSRNMSRPRSDFRLRVTPFLLEFSSRKNHASSPRLSESAVRPCSPEGGSILTTSAPSHASICVALGPASYCVKSSTRIPSRAFAIVPPDAPQSVKRVFTSLSPSPYRGASRVPRGAPSAWGVGGHLGAPHVAAHVAFPADR